MCGHFAIDYDRYMEMMEYYSITEAEGEDFYLKSRTENHYYPSHQDMNIFIPAIVTEEGKRKVQAFRWDLVPSWWKKPLTEKRFSSHNARVEGIAEKPTFRGAWQKGQRCIIPATSFFEWPDKKLVDKGAKRLEHEVRMADQEAFAIAGIWDECVFPDMQNPLRSCTMITTMANYVVGKIPHIRMPAILEHGQETVWLDPETDTKTAMDLVKPYDHRKMYAEEYGHDN